MRRDDFCRFIGYHGWNAKPVKTETTLVLCARSLSMVLDNVGDIGEPFGIPLERLSITTYPHWQGIS